MTLILYLSLTSVGRAKYAFFLRPGGSDSYFSPVGAVPSLLHFSSMTPSSYCAFSGFDVDSLIEGNINIKNILKKYRMVNFLE
jgi:hypothetical protein